MKYIVKLDSEQVEFDNEKDALGCAYEQYLWFNEQNHNMFASNQYFYELETAIKLISEMNKWLNTNLSIEVQP